MAAFKTVAEAEKLLSYESICFRRHSARLMLPPPAFPRACCSLDFKS